MKRTSIFSFAEASEAVQISSAGEEVESGSLKSATYAVRDLSICICEYTRHVYDPSVEQRHTC